MSFNTEGPHSSERRLLRDVLERAVDEWPNKTAIRTETGEWTYRELWATSVALAARMANRGVGPGERVVIVGDNSLELVASIFAASLSGAAFVVLDSRIKPYLFRSIVVDAQPRVVVGDAQSCELAARVQPDTLTLSLAEVAGINAADFGPTRALASGLATASASTTAALLYTSGSTAIPKGVISSHANISFALDAIQRRLQINGDDVIGCFLPLAFDYGLYQVLLTCQVGATLALGSRRDVGPGLLRRISEWRVSVLPIVPPMAAVVLRLAERAPTTCPALRVITNTGARMPESQGRRLLATFAEVRLFMMYGLTECKRVSILMPDEYDARPQSVGTALDGTDCLVVDAEGRTLPSGEEGELIVRGPHVMGGYWRAPDLTEQRFRPFGARGERVLHTGDVCSLDESGYLYFHGRDDDIFKQHGFRVSAVEIEVAATDIPGVEEAVLIPGGSSVLYFAGDASELAVFRGLQARLEDFKLPASTIRLDQMPLTANGKFDKQALSAVDRNDQ